MIVSSRQINSRVRTKGGLSHLAFVHHLVDSSPKPGVSTSITLFKLICILTA